MITFLWVLGFSCLSVAVTAVYFRAEVKIAYEDRDYYKEMLLDCKEGLSGTVVKEK